MELTWGTELEKAIFRMHKNGLTQYDTLSGYRPEDPLLREEAAKIIGQAYSILGFPQETKTEECNFKDRELFNPTLAPFITSTCKVSIFKGNKGLFHPHTPLTKAEALTVLIRILEGKSSSESFDPRWTLYFIKAKGISLTQESQVMQLQRPVTRGEIALLIYRFKAIILNQQLHQAAKNQLSTIDTNPQAFLTTTQTGTQLQTGTQTSQTQNNDILGLMSGNNSSTTSSLSVLNSPEVNEAITRMYDQKMTSSREISTYQPFAQLTREQAAKMFTQFAKALNISALTGGALPCKFRDLNQADSSLKSSIEEACKLGIMQGNNGYFSPQTILKKSEFITMLIRLSEGKRLNENGNPRWKDYFLKAKELWILNNEDALSFELPLTRYEAALFFYRFQIKQKITSHLNTESLKNELISTKKTSDGKFASGDNEGTYAVTFDINLLKNQFFQAGFIELLGTRYELKKTNITVFDIGEESFVRYGDLFDMQKETKVWTTSFVISNGNLVQGTIRLTSPNKTRLIKESKSTNARFTMSSL